MQRPVYNSAAQPSNNRAPITAADSAATPRSTAVTINVLANDSDPEGDTLTITGTSKPQFGGTVISGRNVIYTPIAGFAGQDRFTYFISDGHGNTTAGSVSVIVGGQLQGYLNFLPVIRR
jgi:hypothetical protein